MYCGLQYLALKFKCRCEEKMWSQVEMYFKVQGGGGELVATYVRSYDRNGCTITFLVVQ